MRQVVILNYTTYNNFQWKELIFDLDHFPFQSSMFELDQAVIKKITKYYI